jgi:hypothetical protein
MKRRPRSQQVAGPALELVSPSRETTDRSPHTLTLHERSVALPDNVRDLLDWLIDEELKRWQRETR